MCVCRTGGVAGTVGVVMYVLELVAMQWIMLANAVVGGRWRIGRQLFINSHQTQRMQLGLAQSKGGSHPGSRLRGRQHQFIVSVDNQACQHRAGWRDGACLTWYAFPKEWASCRKHAIMQYTGSRLTSVPRDDLVLAAWAGVTPVGDISSQNVRKPQANMLNLQAGRQAHCPTHCCFPANSSQATLWLPRAASTHVPASVLQYS